MSEIEELSDDQIEDIHSLEMWGDRVSLGENGFESQVVRDLNFSPEDIDSAIVEQPGLFAFYAEQSRRATKKAVDLKLMVSSKEAVLDKEIRQHAADKGEKVTEKLIEKAIFRNASYTNLCSKHNDAKATSQMLRDVLDGLKQRRDMLIQAGVSRREEMKGSFVIKEDGVGKKNDYINRFRK